MVKKEMKKEINKKCRRFEDKEGILNKKYKCKTNKINGTKKTEKLSMHCLLFVMKMESMGTRPKQEKKKI